MSLVEVDEFDLDIRIEPTQLPPLHDCDEPAASEPGSTCQFTCWVTCGGTCECVHPTALTPHCAPSVVC
jgi:hypothetical protein